jgi:NAD+ diphosphatase
MLSIPASRPNVYTGSPLDRVSAQRDDEAFVAAALASPGALFIPVWRGRSLMKGVAEGTPEAVLLTTEAATKVRMAEGPWALLGITGPGLTDTSVTTANWTTANLAEGHPVFAVDCSAAEDPLPLLPEGFGEFADLRGVAGLLPAGEASMLAHARGLMHWRTRHRFCGVCGNPCEPRSAGNAMTCTVCGAQHFPRTDPAVIMLVVRNDSVLLGHSTRFPNTTMFSTLAGFVEPGESLEEAVRREVMEESGIKVGEVRYHSSQPWPFPASIMLGFHAEGLSDTITIDPTELSDARWFTRAEIRDPASAGITLPRLDSIARRLIEDWLEAE